MSNNTGNNDSMATREEASNGAENGRGMSRRRRRRYSNGRREVEVCGCLHTVARGFFSGQNGSRVPTYKFTSYPSDPSIIYIDLTNSDGEDEINDDTTSNFYNEGDVVDESDEPMGINRE
ncbi:uncharacterized protein LOC111033856 [Myzus persicae]|uniref:uncharacterized protein LOC111033856 n=1 Tax=Myzus persicae TaxID=13164 RepID=UPI000B931AD1|nr:uncharacterized protein LOC111033856 [Myzus persicae]XP_022170485.1 uncharacterized protein LOC111033856 [Myzus persicae]